MSNLLRTMSIATILSIVAVGLGYLSWQSGGLLQSRALSQLDPLPPEVIATDPTATSLSVLEELCEQEKRAHSFECGYLDPEQDHGCRTADAEVVYQKCLAAGVSDEEVELYFELQEELHQENAEI